MMTKIFLSICNMSLTGTFLIAILCLARLFLKRAPKVVSYWLWAIAGVRLLLPFSIESAISLIPVKAQAIPTNLAAQTTTGLDTGIPAINTALLAMLPGTSSGASTPSLQTRLFGMALLWMMGGVLMALYGGISALRLRHSLKQALHVKDNLYIQPSLRSPFVLGCFSPRIYLPAGLSEKDQSYILRHEQTHIHRRDPLIKMVAYGILCLHWFNPMVWLAFSLMNKDMEMSCDEQVLKDLEPSEKKGYALSLLSLASPRFFPGSTPLAFGENAVKTRIKNMLQYKKASRKGLIIALLFVLLLSFALLFSRGSDGNFLDSLFPMTMNNVSKEPHFSGTVMEAGPGQLLVKVNPDEEASKSSELLYVSLNVQLKDSETDFLTGDEVTVYYNGLIAESYPGQVNTVYAIIRTSQDMRVFQDDLYALAEQKTPYVGDNSAVGNILGELPHVDRYYRQQYFSIGDTAAPYSLTVYYEPNGEGTAGDVEEAYLQRNGALLFLLIDNLEEVRFAFRTDESDNTLEPSAYTTTFTYTRQNMESYLSRFQLTFSDFENNWNSAMDQWFSFT